MRPKTDKALGQCMSWVGVTPVRRYQEHYHCRGGRRRLTKTVQELSRGRRRLLPGTVPIRRRECGACRLGRACRRLATWCALCRRVNGDPELPLSPWPLEHPRDWVAWVNRPLSEEPTNRIRTCVQRGCPLGPEPWMQQTAVRLGLQFTLRGPTRPRHSGANQ